MIEYAQIPNAFNYVSLLSYDRVPSTSVVIACHQYMFNVADQERKRTQELHMCSTPYTNSCIHLLLIFIILLPW